MRILERILIIIIGSFLKGYIFLFGDDPEAIAYAGLAFVIFYACVIIIFMALCETVIEYYLIYRIRYQLKRRRMWRRIHRAVERKKNKQQRETKIRKKISSEEPGKEESKNIYGEVSLSGARNHIYR